MISTMEKVLILRSVPMLRALPSESLLPVAQIAAEVDFVDGDTVIREGDEGDCLYVIVSGEVDVLVGEGKRVASMSARSTIGEMAVLADIARTASCVARGDVLALRIDREDFNDLVADHGQIGLGIVRELIGRLNEANRRSA